MVVFLFCLGQSRQHQYRIQQNLKKEAKAKSKKLYYEKKKLEKGYVHNCILRCFTENVRKGTKNLFLVL